MPNLDRLIDIQVATEVQDSAGQPVQTWADYEVDVPAEYRPVSGREFFAAQQEQAEAVARFLIRYRSDITRGTMRVVYESETYDIVAAEEDRRWDRRQYLLLTCEAKPA